MLGKIVREALNWATGRTSEGASGNSTNFFTQFAAIQATRAAGNALRRMVTHVSEHLSAHYSGHLAHNAFEHLPGIHPTEAREQQLNRIRVQAQALRMIENRGRYTVVMHRGLFPRVVPIHIPAQNTPPTGDTPENS